MLMSTLTMLTNGVSYMIPTNLLLWKDVICVVVCSKAMVEDPEDDVLLEEVDIPVWMELDTLYFYSYHGKGDKSEAIDKVSGLDFKAV